MRQAQVVPSNAEFAKQITSAVAGELKRAGFRKRGNLFNRALPGGVMHIVQFVLQPSWGQGVGHGLFEFAVFTPRADIFKRAFTEWIPSGLGQMQVGAETLRPDYVWPDDFDVTQPATVDRMSAAVFENGLPWLQRYPDELSLLEAYEENGEEFASDSLFGVAELYRATGDETRAREVAASVALRKPRGGSGETVRNFLTERNWLDLIDLIPERMTYEEIRQEYEQISQRHRERGDTPRELRLPAPRIFGSIEIARVAH